MPSLLSKFEEWLEKAPTLTPKRAVTVRAHTKNLKAIGEQHDNELFRLMNNLEGQEPPDDHVDKKVEKTQGEVLHLPLEVQALQEMPCLLQLPTEPHFPWPLHQAVVTTHGWAKERRGNVVSKLAVDASWPVHLLPQFLLHKQEVATL